MANGKTLKVNEITEFPAAPRRTTPLRICTKNGVMIGLCLEIAQIWQIVQKHLSRQAYYFLFYIRPLEIHIRVGTAFA
jgi:hypothetical protein